MVNVLICILHTSVYIYLRIYLCTHTYIYVVFLYAKISTLKHNVNNAISKSREIVLT